MPKSTQYDTFVAALKNVSIPSIRWNRETKKHDDIKVYPTVIERDGMVLVSAEDGEMFADYYNEFGNGCPEIHKALEQFAKDHNGFWEWENPGAIYFVEN